MPFSIVAESCDLRLLGTIYQSCEYAVPFSMQHITSCELNRESLGQFGSQCPISMSHATPPCRV
jgi:hypothetical protein